METDLEAFDTLALRLRGDGRKYIVTLRTDAWIALPARPLPFPPAFTPLLALLALPLPALPVAAAEAAQGGAAAQ